MKRRKFLATLGARGVTYSDSLLEPEKSTVSGDEAALYRGGDSRTAKRGAATSAYSGVGTSASVLTTPPLPVIAFNRIAFGPRPGDIDAFMALGEDDDARLAAYVDQQLDPGSIDDSDLDARLSDPAFQTLGKSLLQLWADHVLPDDLPWDDYIRPVRETSLAAFVRGIHSKRQLLEVLTDFWHNHFNVYGWDLPAAGTWVHYDRDVIRANALGNFRVLLEAVTRSTPMLYYLDNYTSSDDGPNENFARELLELHGLGAENYLGVMPQWEVPIDSQGRPLGYVDGDVLEVARCFTGWTVANGHWSDPQDPDTGEFYYRDFWHDRFQKYVLGEFFPADQAALVDGQRVLDKIAEHPGTARHVCRKLCRRLIADNPPESIVQSAADVFHQQWQASDQIKQVVRHILLSTEFRSTWGEKVKRPFETVVSVARACDADFPLLPGSDNTDVLFWLFGSTGHSPFSWPPPNGYPDVRAVWQGSTALVMTWRVVNWLLNEQNADSSQMMDVLPATLQAFPDSADRTPNNLAAFWYERLLGYMPDAGQVSRAAAFLTQSDSYTGSWGLDSPVDLDVNEWPHYWQSGVRTLVGLIAMSPEFHQR